MRLAGSTPHHFPAKAHTPYRTARRHTLGTRGKPCSRKRREQTNCGNASVCSATDVPHASRAQHMFAYYSHTEESRELVKDHLD
jgi:hypothetical protein